MTNFYFNDFYMTLLPLLKCLQPDDLSNSEQTGNSENVARVYNYF